jgi:hypothetical protein
MGDLEIAHDPDRGRFEALIEGQVAFLEYERKDAGRVDYRFTWVPPSLRGRGIGHRLVTHALNWAKEEGLEVIPSCWFVADVIAHR